MTSSLACQFNRLIGHLALGLPPEMSHDLAISLLKRDWIHPGLEADSLGMQVDLAGLKLPHPVMLAAGLDKQGYCLSNLSCLGFSAIEAGTVVPQPQPGNPKPRLFRLKEDSALINRFGFNSVGANAFFEALGATKPADASVLGVNIGANKDSPDRIADYLSLVARAVAIADYLTINVSSPNTPGLRDLQEKESLQELVGGVRDRADDVPVFVKLAPDTDDETLEVTLRMLADMGINGVILSNTTTDRPDTLMSASAAESGGLSGRPLFQKTLARVAFARHVLPDRVSIIASGGIFTGHDVHKVMRAGADAVQIYTAFVYRGIDTVPLILSELKEAMEFHEIASLSDVIARET